MPDLLLVAACFTSKKRRKATNPQDTDSFQHSECSLRNYAMKKRDEVHLKKWCIFFLNPSPISRAQRCILVLTCLAASYLPFLPNLWCFSGVSVTTQDDEIEQMSSSLWDFWCLFGDSGGLGPSSPFWLTLQLLHWKWCWQGCLGSTTTHNPMPLLSKPLLFVLFLSWNQGTLHHHC